MAIKESAVAPVNQQGLDIQSTPRGEMELYPLDTFAYEFPGKEIKIDFEITNPDDIDMDDKGQLGLF